jgi:hypothetical protein
VKKRTQIVGNIKPGRARLADPFKVLATLVRLARVYHTTLCEDEQLVEKRNNVRTRLVNGEDNGAVVVACQRV